MPSGYLAVDGKPMSHDYCYHQHYSYYHITIVLLLYYHNYYVYYIINILIIIVIIIIVTVVIVVDTMLIASLFNNAGHRLRQAGLLTTCRYWT